MTTVDDLTALLARATRLEQDALDALVEMYSSRLYGFLLRLTGSRTDAEDLVQEVFVRLVRTISRYDHHGRFEAWLFRIAGNLARDRVRRLRRQPLTVSIDDPPRQGLGGASPPGTLDASSDDSPGDSMERAEQVDRLQEAIAKLPDAEREVILLRHYAQLSFSEIANAMGTPVGTALARAHRGLNKLRQWMQAP